MKGLEWLARVGPARLEAWRCAMAWSEVAARSHARRLESEGWLDRPGLAALVYAPGAANVAAPPRIAASRQKKQEGCRR
jgi:hypothetical protein